VFIGQAARGCRIFDSTSVVMAAVDQQRHRVKYATAANASALVLPDLPTGTGQGTRFPLAVMEYVAMARALTKVSAALGLQHMAWHMHLDRLSQLLADADAIGFLEFPLPARWKQRAERF